MSCYIRRFGVSNTFTPLFGDCRNGCGVWKPLFLRMHACSIIKCQDMRSVRIPTLQDIRRESAGSWAEVWGGILNEAR